MNSTTRLLVADGLVKAALIEPHRAGELSFWGGPWAAAAGQRGSGGSWGDTFRMGGRGMAEGAAGLAGGGAAGAGTGVLLAKLLQRLGAVQKGPAGALLGLGGAAVGGTLGARAGQMHGAYRAAQTAQGRQGAVQQVLSALHR